jgi:thiol-disulfide isomerase/thioredoxin
MNLPVTPRPRLVLAALAAILVSLVVLYLILGRAVHAPPPALSRLKLATALVPVPEVTFRDASGRNRALSAFRGRYVLINLWAPWCAPCVRELPALAKLSRAIPGSRLAVIAVDVGRDDAATAARFLADHQASTLAVYLDADFVLMRTFHAYGLPLTLLIDPKGREIGRAVGACEWDAPEAVAYLRETVGANTDTH